MKRSSRKAFDIISYTAITLLTLFCLVPFLLVISGSFTSQKGILADGYRLIPSEFSLEAYRVIFKTPEAILRAYGVSIFITVVGTIISLLFVSMAAYVLSSKDFKYRNTISFLYYFTTIFGGGVVPWYILCVQYLHFKNTYMSMIIPGLVNVTYLLILKSYMKSIPDSIFESARLDGANDWVIFSKIAMPLSKAGMATVTLFVALGYWNDWYNAMLYIDEKDMYPLQYYLYNVLNKSEGLARAGQNIGLVTTEIPTESMKLAMMVIATGPIVCLYPFLQKYFVQGVTIGAVKG